MKATNPKVSILKLFASDVIEAPAAVTGGGCGCSRKATPRARRRCRRRCRRQNSRSNTNTRSRSRG